MGLDIVEIFMQAEETFAIEIKDDEAAAADTVGRLYDLILKKLEEKSGGNVADAEAIWLKVRDLVADQLQVREDEVVPEARFNQDLGAD
jgi:acyl carrier protein